MLKRFYAQGWVHAILALWTFGAASLAWGPTPPRTAADLAQARRGAEAWTEAMGFTEARIVCRTPLAWAGERQIRCSVSVGSPPILYGIDCTRDEGINDATAVCGIATEGRGSP